MKIVFDTNVILSAFLTQGLSSRVLDICIGLHKIIISPWIFNEINIKLKNKFKLSIQELDRVTKFIQSEFKILDPSGTKPTVYRDKDDNNILYIAEYAKADLIITGDKDLLILKKYSEIDIVSPRMFMVNYYKR